MGDFSTQVYELVRQVPYGRVASYGQIAAMMGRPQSGRYVGYALRNDPPQGEEPVPAHRIVRADGSLAEGFADGTPGLQRSLLEEEGVEFTLGGKVDMEHFRWDGRP